MLEITTRRDLMNAHLADPDGPDRPPMSWFRSKGDASVLAEPDSPARIDVRHLERLPLRMDYTDQVKQVAALLRRPPLPPGTRLVIDQTGVGRPVVNMFTAAGLNPVGVTITGGDSETRVSWGQEEFRVAKLLLVSRLQAALHSGTLRIARELPEARILVQELQDFPGAVCTDRIRTVWGTRGCARRPRASVGDRGLVEFATAVQVLPIASLKFEGGIARAP